MRLKGAFAGCKWCGGNGCMGCDEERKKAQERAMQPIFTADPNDPDDMRQMREIFGADAITKTFSPGGGGMLEIEEKAAMASLLQALRKMSRPDPALVGGQQDSSLDAAKDALAALRQQDVDKDSGTGRWG